MVLAVLGVSLAIAQGWTQRMLLTNSRKRSLAGLSQLQIQEERTPRRAKQFLSQLLRWGPSFPCPKSNKPNKQKIAGQEFLLWLNRIGGILGELGCRFNPSPAQWVKDPVRDRSQMWGRSNPQPSLAWKLHVLRGGQKMEKKKKKERKKLL